MLVTSSSAEKISLKAREAGGWGGIPAAVLLRQLGESLEAGLGGHQAADGLEVTFQLGVESR